APPERVALAAPVEWKPALTGFMPVQVAFDDWARPWATPCPAHDSGDFAALARTDGFVELPRGPTELSKGHVARFFRW
ncbi:MAG TPA: hypothetical protein VMF64_04105, partial [Steroidobacteraceae bacterium]|nr:hypothetical protein [Steroidobacteraceae bacterium]